MKTVSTHVIGGKRIDEIESSEIPKDPLDRDDRSSSSSHCTDVPVEQNPKDKLQQTNFVVPVPATEKSSKSGMSSSSDPQMDSEPRKTNSRTELKQQRNRTGQRRLRTPTFHRDYVSKVAKSNDSDSDNSESEDDQDYSENEEEDSELTSTGTGSDLDSLPSTTTETRSTRSSVARLERSKRSNAAQGGESPCKRCGKKLEITNYRGPEGSFCSKACRKHESRSRTSRTSRKPVSPEKRKRGRPFGSTTRKSPLGTIRKSKRIGDESMADMDVDMELSSGKRSNKSTEPMKTSEPEATNTSQKTKNSDSAPKNLDASPFSVPRGGVAAVKDASFAAPSPSSSTKSPVKNMMEDGDADGSQGRRGRRSTSMSSYWSPQCRAYINDKPEYVRKLITEKPLVTWQYEEVAAFVSSVPEINQFAAMMLLETIDGQSLLLYDSATWQKTFNVKLGPCLKLIKEIKTLENYQRKETLKKWYEERPAVFSAALKFLEEQH